MKPKFTAVGRYFSVYVDGSTLSRHTTEREACEKAGGAKLENPNATVLYTHEYVVNVELESIATDQVEVFNVDVEIGL